MTRYWAIALACAAAMLGAATQPKTGEIAITVTDLRSTKGVVRACLTALESAFPQCDKDPAAHHVTATAAERVELVFSGITPGRYAIALLHDENDNGKLDRALFGAMPKEGYGFSRDAKVRMGPPRFDAAAFDYDGSTAVQTIRMRYML